MTKENVRVTEEEIEEAYQEVDTSLIEIIRKSLKKRRTEKFRAGFPFAPRAIKITQRNDTISAS